MKAKELIEIVSKWQADKKIEFLERFLSDMIVMNRAIWDDPDLSDSKKVNCFKWGNELAHRIWNIRFELKGGNDDNSAQRILDNILFYRKQEAELGGHFGATLNSAFEYVKELNAT
jgi:hypothetical protein